jgi:hypothetical protein
MRQDLCSRVAQNASQEIALAENDSGEGVEKFVIALHLQSMGVPAVSRKQKAESRKLFVGRERADEDVTCHHGCNAHVITICVPARSSIQSLQ